MQRKTLWIANFNTSLFVMPEVTNISCGPTEFVRSRFLWCTKRHYCVMRTETWTDFILSRNVSFWLFPFGRRGQSFYHPLNHNHLLYVILHELRQSRDVCLCCGWLHGNLARAKAFVSWSCWPLNFKKFIERALILFVTKKFKCI